MTKQEIFSKVWAHLEAQGRRSMSAIGTCAYRGPGGAMCALGIFLSDEAARVLDLQHNGAGTSAEEIWSRFPEFIPEEFIAHGWKFAQALQAAHDQAQDRGRSYHKGWRENMTDVAYLYDLAIPSV